MGSKENREEQALTETEDETIAAKKKRSRRVSFADVEITSVHIFKRDEDYYDATPPSDPNNNANPKDPPSSAEDSGEGLRLFADLGDLSNERPAVSPRRYEDEDGDDDEDESRKAFFRPDDTPSPGSSNIGSATSNDENFFGPVSASFIRPGRLSDSATSDENHDITMDSTAFSMHFRSLAQSDSGGDFKTPMRTQIAFEEKTPAQNITPTDTSGIMVLTKARLTTPDSSVPLDDDKSSGHDSNAMSLVGENSRSYDYGRLSPTLDALLAEGSKDMHPDYLPDLLNANSSVTSEVSTLNSANVAENLGNGERSEMSFAETVGPTFEHMEVDKAKFASAKKPLQQRTHDFANTTNCATVDVSVNPIIHTPERLIKGMKQSGEDAQERSTPKAAFSILNSTPTSNSKILQPNMPMHQELANQLSTEQYLNENFPHVRSPTLDRQQNVDGLWSPLVGSVSSLSSKRRQIFVDVGNSPANHSTVTPLATSSASLLSKESIDHLSSLLSLRKSISKFKGVESSPRASSEKNGIETLKLKLANYLQPDLPYSKLYVGNNTNALIRHTNSPVSQLKHSHGDDQDDTKLKILSNHESSVVMTPNSTRMNSVLRKSQDLRVVTGNGNLPDGMHDDAVREDLSNTITAAVVSPSKFSWSGDQAKMSGLIPKDSTMGRAVTAESSPFPDVTVHERKDKEETSMLNGNLAFSLKRLGQKMSPMKRDDDCLPDLKLQQDIFYLPNIMKSLNFADSDKFQSSLSEWTSLVDDSILNFRPQGPVRDPQDKAGLASLREETFPGARNASSFTYLSRNTQRPLPKSPYKKVARSPVVESSQRNLGKELCNANASLSSDIHSGGDAIQYSKVNAYDIGSCQPELCHSESSLVVHNEGESSGQKRKGEVLDGDRDHTGKVLRKAISSDVKMSTNCDCLSSFECCNKDFDETEKSKNVEPLMHWNDVLSTLLSHKGEVLCPLADKLDIRGIGTLEEILIYLQKVRNYEILSCQIQSQRKSNQFGNVTNGRLSDTVLLMYKIVYERTVMQLKCVKRDKLQKAAQLLTSRIQECQNLKTTYRKVLTSSNEKYTQLDGSHTHSSLDDANLKLEISDKRRTSVKQELEVLDKKLKDLTEALSYHCKMEGDLTGSNVLEAVKSHLKKRMFCRLLHQDLQLWRFGDFKSQNDHQSIFLNYLGLISQRFTLTVKPISNITVSNNFEDRKIEKNFPSMDACVAFAFVFDSGTTKRCFASNPLAHETQTAHLLLRTLLDVVAEVKLARIKIKNLIWTKFHSPSDRQLDLLCCFVDTSNCRKVEISIDVSCLKRGIYPSESIIHQVEATSTDGMSKSLPVSLNTEIRDAVEGLNGGQLSVMRLCQCISSVLSSSN